MCSSVSSGAGRAGAFQQGRQGGRSGSPPGTRRRRRRRRRVGIRPPSHDRQGRFLGTHLLITVGWRDDEQTATRGGAGPGRGPPRQTPRSERDPARSLEAPSRPGSCCPEDPPPFVGGHGTAARRRGGGAHATWRGRLPSLAVMGRRRGDGAGAPMRRGVGASLRWRSWDGGEATRAGGAYATWRGRPLRWRSWDGGGDVAWDGTGPPATWRGAPRGRRRRGTARVTRLTPAGETRASPPARAASPVSSETRRRSPRSRSRSSRGFSPARHAGSAGARLGARLFHRRGGIFHRHAAPGTPGGAKAASQGAAVRHRYRQQGYRASPSRHLPGQHRRRRLAGTTGALLRSGAGRQLLPHPQEHPRHAGLFRAGRAPGPAVFQTRPGQLPQPVDLHGRGTAEEAHPPVPLRLESGRLPLPGHLRDRGRVRGPLCHSGSQNEAVPTQRGCSRRASHGRGAVCPPLAEDGAAPHPSAKAPGQGKLPLRELTERALLQEYAPVGALVDERGDILYLHGRTGRYLEPAPGEAGMNILKMAREGLRRELTTALRQAMARKEPVRHPGLRVKTNGDFTTVNLTVRPVSSGPDAAAAPGLFLVILEDAPAADR